MLHRSRKTDREHQLPWLICRFLRKRLKAERTASLFRNSHSQMVSVLHPRSLSCWTTRSSRTIFDEIFFSQKSLLVFGRVFPLGHCVCPCQKHPCTKITLFIFRRTISGVPGRHFEFLLTAQPSSLTIDLTILSGSVLQTRTRAIKAERSASTSKV